MIVFACIAPHGDVDLDPTLRASMDELGRRFDAAKPDAACMPIRKMTSTGKGPSLSMRSCNDRPAMKDITR